MATINMAAGDHGAYQKTLVATVVDVVNLPDDLLHVVEVRSDASALVYVTGDGTAPVAGAQNTWELPNVAGAVRRIVVQGGQVRVVSAGTPKYSVTVDPA